MVPEGLSRSRPLSIRVSTDPTVIRSIVVTVDDVVTAVEAARSGKQSVLRITPPFSGRMRARLHLDRSRDDPESIHIDPQSLLDADAPSHPTPAETEDRLRASEREYSIDTHQEYHVETVREWRETVRDFIVDSVTIETANGPHTIDVKPLG